MKALFAAITGLAVLGSTAVGVYFAIPGGSEEEVVSQAPEPSLVPPPPPIEQVADPLLTPAPPPPTPPYTCIYTVLSGAAVCLGLDNPLVKDCPLIEFQGRAACLPPGAQLSSVIAEYPAGCDESCGPRYFEIVTRGNSVIRYANGLLEYTVAPEDEADFRALRELFLAQP